MKRLLPLLFLASALGCADNYAALQAGDPAPVATLNGVPDKARVERIIIVSIDGCRPDAIDAANAQTIKKLIARGAYCDIAQTVRPSITLPSHTAMLTGLDFQHHEVVWNNYRTGYIVHPTVFSVVTQVGKKTAMLFSKDKFHFLANPACVNWIYGPPVPNKIPKREDFSDPEQLKELLKKEEDAAKLPAKKPTTPPPGDLMTTADMLARAFAAAWPEQKWALTFIHFRETDENGHKKGWMGPEYLEGLQQIDRALSVVVDVIEKNGGFEKTALIVTADHGGSGRGHYRWTEPDKAENVTIPWICVGPGIPAGLKIERIIRTYDTTPTSLALLGLGAPAGIDGKVVEEVLR
ncbi:MAG TPA: alkaline phosphatase family protein [Planctomycetota bacterium]|nr:alkaline phosphatase family protein [Planctomycetota bacterium]